MMERDLFESHLDSIINISSEIKDLLWKNVEVFDYKKGENSLKQGEIERYVCFLTKGIIRAQKDNGEKEVTIDFMFPGEFVTGFTSYISNAPSPYSLEMIEAGRVIKFPKKLIEDLYRKEHQFERLGRLTAEFAYLKRTRIETEILMLTAEERYRELINNKPKLVGQIPVKHMASYLGIQPQSLSRIRAKI